MKKQFLGIALVVILTAAYASGESAATRWRTIHTFTGGTDGSYPLAPLLADAKGNLYGTTGSGGNAACKGFLYTGCGTIFELVAPSSPEGIWREQILYAFSGGIDGSGPVGGLIFDAAGNLYGTTEEGGDLGNKLCSSGAGCGVVFELSPPKKPGGAWTETVLHTFEEGGADGAYPEAGLVFDKSGNLYGTTLAGNDISNGGVVFELSPAVGGVWTESILYSFMDGSDGYGPSSPLIFDESGNLYSTTAVTVFQLVPPTGSGLWTLNTIAESGSPAGSLLMDASGDLFGTAFGGGNYGHGLAYELVPPQNGGLWTKLFLWNFIGGTDAYPIGFVADGAGNLYGATRGNYNNVCGEVFDLSNSDNGWNRIVLHSFTDARFDQGCYPRAQVVFGKWNALYGTTSQGGDESCGSSYGCGTVFGLLP